MENTKNQACLWVIATPIGNLQDISLRAHETLKKVDGVLCEDTRRTLQLMRHLKLEKPLYRLDAHSKESVILKWVREMENGKSLALVTDAGTPAVSDPGAKLVKLARNAGVKIEPIPGVSAVTTLLSVSGFEQTSFCFCGFFPRKTKEKKQELEKILSSSFQPVWVWFESPERITSTFDFFNKNLPDAQVVVGKELTKIHEKFFCGSVTEVFLQVKNEIKQQGTKGEWSFALYDPTISVAPEVSLDWFKALECLIEQGISPSQSVRIVSHKFGVAKKIVYEAFLRAFQHKNE